LEDAAEALNEGGLAGALVPGEGDAFFVPDGEGEIFEDDTRSKLNAEVFDGKHAGGLVEECEDENQKARRSLWRR
jgi:hypothetical protein